jgi:protein-glutamine gamma-glutamyltransferase
MKAKHESRTLNSPKTFMPQAAKKFEVIPISQAINRYFELSIYLLVLMGFGTLASTGTLDLPTVALVGSALAFRGYLLARGRRLVFSQRWTAPLSVAYFVFYGADYFLFSRSFLAATVHLVLFAVVVRTFSLRRDRDYVMLTIVAFLMVLASAVLTVDSIFLAFFAGFMLTAVASFILMEMRRSARAAQIQARHSHDMQEHRHLAFSLARLSPALALSILTGAALIFFVLPRTASGYMSAYSFGTNFSTGFSDRVRLGGIGQIQQSNAVVMHIQIDGDNRGRYALHWRGVSLSIFDGANWSNPSRQYILPRNTDGSFSIPEFGQEITQELIEPDGMVSREGGHLIHYRVLMEPIGTNVFFLAPWARRVGGAYRQLQIDSGAAVSNIDSQRGVGIYEADSDISEPSPDLLRQAGTLAPDFAKEYLQLPDLDPRIPRLALQISSSASNNYDKAVAIERYLKTHYGYTLQLLRFPVADPLANFLFERKQGHCEYFASSMAVMLRTLRIPARVVNGFRSAEFNDITGNYVIRAKDAHAWVEAYFPGYGWITFDPTPGGTVESLQGWERAALYLDAAASFWREWVVSYDSSHQYLLGHSVMSGTRSNLDRMRIQARLFYFRLLSWTRKGQQGVVRTGWRLGAGLGLAFIVLMLASSGRILRIIQVRKLKVHPERSPERTATILYERMIRHLAHRGFEKPKSSTAQELVHAIDDAQLQARVQQFSEAYESARFGNSVEDAKRLPELLGEVEAAGKR